MPKPFPDARGSAPSPDAEPDPADVGDALVSVDSGADPVDSGSMLPNDTGMPLGPICMEALQCCDELSGFLRSTCIGRVESGDEGTCMQAISVARSLGYCTGMEAGTRDAGPLGPICMEYLACCPQLSIGGDVCMRVANQGDEMRCQSGLDLARRGGACLMSMDAGTSSTADASVPMIDAGTSTVGADAGTSTTADAG